MNNGVANQTSTVSELKILPSENESRGNNDAIDKDPNLTTPQTAGMTSGFSGQVDKEYNSDLKPEEEARKSRTAQRLGPGTGIDA
jgi:hypothetical protein